MSISLNKSVSHFDGDFMPSTVVTLTNRTGGALIEGDMVAVNLDFANSTYDELNPLSTDGTPNANYVLGAAVSTTVNNQFGIVAWAKGPIASGARGQFAVSGLHRVQVATGATAGQILTGAAGKVASNIAGTQVGLTALTNATAVLGQLVEANASGATAARLAVVNGFLPRLAGRGAS